SPSCGNKLPAFFVSDRRVPFAVLETHPSSSSSESSRKPLSPPTDPLPSRKEPPASPAAPASPPAAAASAIPGISAAIEVGSGNSSKVWWQQFQMIFL